jgi:HD-GYP domain-containing protein (c-di-GMP phosphodiesterase class II)
MAAGIGGMLHDIGLVSLPKDLFMKQGTCTRQEHELFKSHPIHGLEIIQKNNNTLPDGVYRIIAQHHERVNGDGYPAKLYGTGIDELAIVCAIADMYDILTTKDMFNKTYLPQEALALIFQGSDEEFPRSFIEHFLKLLGIYPVGSFVKLDTGEMGVVIKNNRNKLLTPTVRILFNNKGDRIGTPYVKDLSVIDYESEDRLTRILHSLDPSSFKVEIENFIIQHKPN